MLAYLVPFLLTLAACFGIQALGLRAVGGRTAKSESNFSSSLARLQAGSRRDVEIMLLGSSVTGRLPDQAAGFKGVANLGCDGGTAVDALRAMDEGILSFASCLVIEANYLHRALDPAPTEISQALRRPWFRVGIQFPLLSAYARPSAFLYSTLLARQIGGFGDPATDEDLQVTSRPARLHNSAAEPLSGNERSLIDELVPLLRRLQQKGCRTVFVWLPPGREPGSPIPPWIAALVAESDSEWWDLGTEANREWVVLTDGVHMASPSAARTVRSLRKGLGN